MSRRFRRIVVGRCLSWAALGMLSLALTAPTRPTRAAEPDDFAEHIEAGEFAAAWQLADEAGAGRDDALSRIAAAQLRAGDRRDALATVGEIADDRIRRQALDDMRSGGGGFPGGNNGGLGGQPIGQGGQGGAPEPDFEALIELITSVIAPQSWDEVGGPGSIREFEGGVRVDADGLVHSLLGEDVRDARLDAVREASARPSAQADVRRLSQHRKVSLTRLEKAVQLRLAAGLPLDEEMQVLAGLQRIEYVLVYPETGDIVVAGPAGDWRTDDEGRIVGTQTGHPAMRLDDLVVVLRQAYSGEGRFGCSITPLPEALARTKAFLEESAKTPLKPSRRNAWLQELQAAMGEQAIEYYGIDPQTRVARVLFEADYRMKLVGIGLEDGVREVPSYLDMVRVPAGEAPPPLGVLRWWFTLDYDSLVASPRRDAFEFHGQGVKVLSENELLTAEGQRVHTGESEPLNQQYARNFTRHFAELAVKYPVYAELQNVCNLALAAALIKAEDLPAQVGWHMTCFGDPQQYAVAVERAPQRVQTVINHRVINRKHILAAASGGVRVDPTALVAPGAIVAETTNRLDSEHERFAPVELSATAWWWD